MGFKKSGHLGREVAEIIYYMVTNYNYKKYKGNNMKRIYVRSQIISNLNGIKKEFPQINGVL